MSQNGGLRQFLLLEQHRERVVSRVLSDDLLDLNAAIRKVVVEDEELVSAIVALILPEDVEAEHLAVVVQERLKVLVRAATLQLNLDVLLHFSLVGRRLLEVDHGASVGKVVRWTNLGLVELNAIFGIESLCELVTVADAEDATVDIQILGHIQILPGVVLGLVLSERQLVALEENTLRHTGVLNTWFDDVQGVILEVVEDVAVADAEVLVGVLDDWLLEVSVELEHLKES